MPPDGPAPAALPCFFFSLVLVEASRGSREPETEAEIAGKCHLSTGNERVSNALAGSGHGTVPATRMLFSDGFHTHTYTQKERGK